MKMERKEIPKVILDYLEFATDRSLFIFSQIEASIVKTEYDLHKNLVVDSIQAPFIYFDMAKYIHHFLNPKIHFTQTKKYHQKLIPAFFNKYLNL